MISLKVRLVAILAISILASTAEAQILVRTVVVSPTVGDQQASGATLLNAVANANGTWKNPWLVKVEPGLYDLGTTSLAMKPYVHIEGAGQKATIIRGLGQLAGTLDRGKGVVNGSSAAEIRDLTIQCKTDQANPACICMANVDASPVIKNVAMSAVDSEGSHWGIRNINSSPSLTDVSIAASNGGFNYGIVNAFNSFPSIKRSTIKATNGATSNHGLFNREYSNPSLVEDTVITVAGGDAAEVIRFYDGTLPLSVGPESTLVESRAFPANAPLLTLRRVTASAQGAAATYGVRGGYYTLLMDDSDFRIWGTPGTGIDIYGDVTINRSTIVGSTIRVSGWDVKIGASWLRGAGVVQGLVDQKCAAVYDGDMNFFASTCP